MCQVTQFKNGLTVATAEMRHIMSMDIGVWVGVGSRYERQHQVQGLRNATPTLAEGNGLTASRFGEGYLILVTADKDIRVDLLQDGELQNARRPAP